MRRRTKAREIALQLLYQADLCSEVPADQEERIAEDARGDTEVAVFARRLFEGTLQSRDAIDEKLRRVAANWDLPRMATVDRNILRMSVYELLHCADIPPKVTINEGIELGKRFSTAKSGGFINGILDRVRIDLESQKSTARSADAAEAGSGATPKGPAEPGELAAGE